jgi:hypothetical protein
MLAAPEDGSRLLCADEPAARVAPGAARSLASASRLALVQYFDLPLD